MRTIGNRTFFGTLFGMTLLTLGLSLVEPKDRGGAFMAFSVGLVGLAGALTIKGTAGVLAAGNGVEGAKAALLTSAKPGDPPAPAVTP